MRRHRKLKQPVVTISREPLAPAQLFAPHAFETQVQLLKGQPMVYMTREAFSRMWHITDIGQDEVGWLGTVSRTPRGNFLIDEVFLVRQQVSGATTEMSADGISELAQNLLDTREDGVDLINRIRFWGHSHVMMDTHPSGQDEQQMEQFRQDDCPWFVRGIVNRRGRMQFDIFLWESGIKITDARWGIYDMVEQELRDGIAAEFADKVTSRPSYPSHGYPGVYYGTMTASQERELERLFNLKGNADGQ